MNDAFLRHIGFGHIYYCDTAFLRCILCCNVKVDWVWIQCISVRCLYFYQIITLTILQSLRCNQIPLFIGIEGIDLGKFGISVLHGYFCAIRAIDLECSSRIGNCKS